MRAVLHEHACIPPCTCASVPSDGLQKKAGRFWRLWSRTPLNFMEKDSGKGHTLTTLNVASALSFCGWMGDEREILQVLQDAGTLHPPMALHMAIHVKGVRAGGWD